MQKFTLQTSTSQVGLFTHWPASPSMIIHSLTSRLQNRNPLWLVKCIYKFRLSRYCQLPGLILKFCNSTSGNTSVNTCCYAFHILLQLNFFILMYPQNVSQLLVMKCSCSKAGAKITAVGVLLAAQVCLGEVFCCYACIQSTVDP